MPHQDLEVLFLIWACMALVTLVLTEPSLGPGYSVPHLGLNRPVDHGPRRLHMYLLPLITTGASRVPGNTVPHLVLIWTS